jgi:hypothetical protein
MLIGAYGLASVNAVKNFWLREKSAIFLTNRTTMNFRASKMLQELVLTHEKHSAR